jgi:hypothetical protein
MFQSVIAGETKTHAFLWKTFHNFYGFGDDSKGPGLN